MAGPLAALLRAWRRRRGRRARGRAGEQRVGDVLDEFASRHRVKVRHRLPLASRRGRRGDLDHVIVVGRRPKYIVAIETKAERPHPAHLDQVRANAQRASRRYFRDAPQYRIVVHPNSNEPVTYDGAARAARMGLPRLPAYLRSLLDGAHPDRLAR
jgi:Nuclease-related domain